MKPPHPEFFHILLRLQRKKPPLAVLRIFRRGQWVQENEQLYKIRLPGATSRSLRAEISRHLRSDESVAVHGVTAVLNSAGLRQRVTWESVYRPPKGKRRLKKRSARELKLRRDKSAWHVEKTVLSFQGPNQ